MVPRRSSCWAVLLSSVTLVVAAAAAHARKPKAEPRPKPPPAAVADSVVPSDALLLGEYELARAAVIDGDTILVRGLDRSLRLLAIDTEETFKLDRDRRDAEADFSAYAARKRGDSPVPVKFGTPMGEAASGFASAFFRGVDRVRLEYDDHRRKVGFYGRHLVYVWARKEGHWTLYNLEAVRAGMSPYFVKYGRSDRFHDAFVAAQTEAREAGRGIWAAGAAAYPDYDERLAWWSERADAIAHFRSTYAHRKNHFEMGSDGLLERLKELEGETVTLFGIFGDPKVARTPYLVPLSHRKDADFLIVCFDDEELARIAPERWPGKHVYVRGRVSLFRGKPQFKADDVEKIWVE